VINTNRSSACVLKKLPLPPGGTKRLEKTSLGYPESRKKKRGVTNFKLKSDGDHYFFQGDYERKESNTISDKLDVLGISSTEMGNSIQPVTGLRRRSVILEENKSSPRNYAKTYHVQQRQAGGATVPQKGGG